MREGPVLGLTGKVALVTGAANGIGRAIAERFVHDGARVAVVDIEADGANQAVKELGGPDHALALTADISDRQQVIAAIAKTVATFGRLDIVAANAAIGDGQPFLDVSEKSWRRVIDINLTGTFFTVQEAARAMAATGGGAIVVTSSTNGWYVESNMAPYNASKGGVIALVRSAAQDLAKFNIRVNAVEPSMVKTRAAFVTTDPVGAPAYLKNVPMALFAETSEIASVVAFLDSDEWSYMTGQALTIDCGLTLGVELPLPQELLPGAVR
jgi:NAD(P)-dependent dehydrogenase (short-subunit alcohol dehydrogenase family)